MQEGVTWGNPSGVSPWCKLIFERMIRMGKLLVIGCGGVASVAIQKCAANSG
ncbi:MAG TPA: hypothetical protein IAD28_05455, partial [Candidatus Faeciplasma avium]|nr:hypothetical protein [Candidatus Faeciplasma avium]